MAPIYTCTTFPTSRIAIATAIASQVVISIQSCTAVCFVEKPETRNPWCYTDLFDLASCAASFPVGYHPSHLLITSHCVGRARAMSDQRSLPVAIVFPWTTRQKSQASQAQSHDGGALVQPRQSVRLDMDLATPGDLAFINSKLGSIGLPEYTPRQSASVGDVANMWDRIRMTARGCICGVALLKLPGVRSQGPLSLATREHRLLDRLAGQHSGLCFFEVLDAVSMTVERPGSTGDSPDLLVPCFRSRRANSMPVKGKTIKRDIGRGVDSSCDSLLDRVVYRRVFGDARLAEAGTLRAVIEGWHQRHGCPLREFEESPCLWNLWAPIAALAVAREWPVLATVLDDSMVQPWRVHESLLLDLPPPPPPSNVEMDVSLGGVLSSHHFQQLGNVLRKWAPVLSGSAAPDSNALEFSEAFITGLVRWADATCDATEAANMATTTRSGRGARGKFRPKVLLSCLLLASLLRKDGHLAEAVEMTLSTLLPHSVVSWMQQGNVQVRSLLPTLSTVSRHRLAFIAAYCLCQQDSWQRAGPTAWFLMVDSSPQFGRDWLMTVVTAVRSADLAALVDHLREAYELAQLALAGDPLDDNVAMSTRRLELGTLVQPMVQHHTLVATAMASGRASLMHKLHGLLHAMFLHLGSWAAVFEKCAAVMVFTTDFGTEAGLRKVRRSVVTHDFLPALGSTWDWPESLPESPGDAPHVPAPAQPAPAPAPPDLLFERALFIPGVLHTLHSVSGEITDTLHHFQLYLEGPTTTLIGRMLPVTTLVHVCLLNWSRGGVGGMAHGAVIFMSMRAGRAGRQFALCPSTELTSSQRCP